MGTIFETLKSIGVASEDGKTLFAARTRDNENLKVWRDSRSRVIYIDDYYVGDGEYLSGEYREAEKAGPTPEMAESTYEDAEDTDRRLFDYKQFYAGRSICEIGFGNGSFLLGAQHSASRVGGVELQASCLSSLREKGVCCEKRIRDHQALFQSVFMFHSLEHFKNPLEILGDVRRQMSKDGSRLIVEVPHANDFLMSTLKSGEFTRFSLWSQHLILHTRESLRRLIEAAGFRNVMISGKQRYGIANHLTWLSDGVSGGHKSPLSSFETDQLKSAYEGALQKIDATDTLVAIADY